MIRMDYTNFLGYTSLKPDIFFQVGSIKHFDYEMVKFKDSHHILAVSQYFC